MKARPLTALSAVLVLLAAGASAEPVREVTKDIEMEGAERLVIEGDLGAGSFRIRPYHMDKAAEVAIEYSPDKVRNEVAFKKRGRIGHLYLDSHYRRHRYDDDGENMWRLRLSDRYPTEIDLEIGAGETEFDFGGIPISDFSLEMGASSGVIDFSRPNPGRIESMHIKIGASSVSLRHLSNAHFDRLSVSCGAASTDLDLTGDVSGEARVEVEVGLGSLDILLPEGVPVRIETDRGGLFSSVDVDDLDVERVHRGVYESPGFAQAENRLIIAVEVGMGSVDFSRQ